jgi:CD109 antigen
MRPKGRFLTLFMLAAVVFAGVPACTPGAPAENYVALVPKTVRSGSTTGVSVALLRGNAPVSGRVEAILFKDGKAIARSKADVDGRGMVNLSIPEVEEGLYDIQVRGSGFEASTPVRIEKSLLLLMQTDKPIYKPGQTIYMRAISLDPELKPTSEMVTVEVLDAKGIKVFRREVVTDEYGMASLDLPLSPEPNLGVWKVSASTTKAKTQLDVRVEKYVLPKYEINADLAREWFLVSEPVKGTISAEYSYGMAVSGEMEIRASRYVGKWQEYAVITRALAGSASFEIPAAGYVAGVPVAGGSGNVMLDITVREKSTGYEEKTSRLLTVAQSEVVLQIVPESAVFKPGIPFDVLLVAETPGKAPVDATAKVTLTFLDGTYKEIEHEERSVKTLKGKVVIDMTPPETSTALVIEASMGNSQTSRIVTASYSPSGNFIHLEQTSAGTPKAGETIRFRVYSTRQPSNFYYEIISRGMVVYSEVTRSRDIEVDTTPLMAPSSRLIVYQILPDSEIAADYLPFSVAASYPQNVNVAFSESEARPGDKVNINIRTEGEAKVGLSAVDRSVFILAENRLNLQQVFDELERLYMRPQVELHEVSLYPAIVTKGAMDVFNDAGVSVLTRSKVPQGRDYKYQGQPGVWNRILGFLNGRGAMEDAAKGGFALAPSASGALPAATDTTTGLAEVQRVRQFFPETWLWDTRIVGSSGRASLQVEVPDNITTWMLQAVAVSKEHGLGMAEGQLKAFQPFFLTVDLPYSAIRGEEFPVNVAVYNYLGEAQSVLVQLEKAPWFDLLDASEEMVEIKANDIGSASFRIRPTALGANSVKISARSSKAADAVVKSIIVNPEGVAREIVENLALSDGTSKTIDPTLPPVIVDGSGRVYLTFTSSYLTQTIEGLETLLQMPFGCGEQNMILLAPDIFITRYLAGSGQLKPEVMAKAEKLMITGYQRELTYRRGDGSFAAFGESDKEGSLWLTAFVLKTFAQAKTLIYVDESVLSKASDWLRARQNADGSFDPVGFVHHQEMLGGVSGKTALTAYVAAALMEAGERTSAGKAAGYLEAQLAKIDDPYTMAIVAYALEMARSGRVGDAHDRLMKMAKEDPDGLHWGNLVPVLESQAQAQLQAGLRMPVERKTTTEIEATAYATLALSLHGDALNSSRAAKWLVSRRNAYGGYGSTQDTVVTLQALTEQATGVRSDVDLTVTLRSGEFQKKLRITAQNFDVLQIVEVTPGRPVEVGAQGKGDVIGQVVTRFNEPAATEIQDQIMKMDVDYDVTEVSVNDLVNVSVGLEFRPPEPMEAGMVVVDVSVPTGFAPVAATIAEALIKEPRLKRYDIAGRKVIFYVENMKPGDRVSFRFQVQAQYPVKARGVASQVYSYYQPEIRGETLGADVTVR